MPISAQLHIFAFSTFRREEWRLRGHAVIHIALVGAMNSVSRIDQALRSVRLLQVLKESLPGLCLSLRRKATCEMSTADWTMAFFRRDFAPNLAPRIVGTLAVLDEVYIHGLLHAINLHRFLSLPTPIATSPAVPPKFAQGRQFKFGCAV